MHTHIVPSLCTWSYITQIITFLHTWPCITHIVTFPSTIQYSLNCCHIQAYMNLCYYHCYTAKHHSYVLRLLSHSQTSDSLYRLCYIPVHLAFCTVTVAVPYTVLNSHAFTPDSLHRHDRINNSLLLLSHPDTHQLSDFTLYLTLCRYTILTQFLSLLQLL